MAHRNYNPSQERSQSFQNYDQIAFSFESRSHEHPPRAADKHRTIEQYLRLKTNESIEDKISGQQSVQLHVEQKHAGRRSISLGKTLKTQEIQSSSAQYQKHLMHQQYELRMQSLIKQFQLKFNKQEDYCKLIQWKHKEQIQNLTQQIHILQQSKKRNKNSSRTLLSNCSICSDGQVINHLKNIINEVEGTHQSCLSNKKQLTKQLDDAKNKLQILQKEHEKLQMQFKNANKQLRASNNDHLKHQQENEDLKNEVANLRMQLYESNDKMRRYKQQCENYEYKFKEYQHKNIMLQDQLKNRQDDLNKQSKTVLLPSSTSVLTNIENNMNSSFLRSRDNISKHKNSISKIMVDDFDGQNNENRQYYKKIHQNSKNNSRVSSNSKMSNQRMQNLRWKYF